MYNADSHLLVSLSAPQEEDQSFKTDEEGHTSNNDEGTVERTMRRIRIILKYYQNRIILII